MSATHEVVLQALRWMHLFFAIVWLGMLYFFNLVQPYYEAGLDPGQKKAVVPALRGRALWWFRWGAMMTLLTGAGYLIYEQTAGGRNFEGWLGQPGDIWITFGIALGLFMWFNVWFVIWPNQQMILRAMGKGETPAELEGWVKRTALVSKINAYLSFPMLAGMGGRSHFSALSTGETWIAVLVVFLAGVGIAVHVVKHVSPKVGREFVS